MWDVLQDGGTATIRGSGLKLDLSIGGKDGDYKGVDVLNEYGTKVQSYRSEKEFVKDLGKFIRAGRTDIQATDADNRRRVDIKKKSADELRTKSETGYLVRTVRPGKNEAIPQEERGTAFSQFISEEKFSTLPGRKYTVEANKAKVFATRTDAEEAIHGQYNTAAGGPERYHAVVPVSNPYGSVKSEKR